MRLMAHTRILAPNKFCYPRNPPLINTSGIGAGTIKGNINGTMTYTLTSPARTSIRLEIANITNISYPGNLPVRMATTDSSGTSLSVPL